MGAPIPVKRIIDLVLACTGLIISAPALLVTALLIKKYLGSPIIYKAQRLGLNCREFTLFKFRTMNEERDNAGNLLEDEERLTRLGRFLRNSSLDELPGLYNVVRGDLSLVGPRPFTALYKNRYTAEQNRRHSVMPGITGWSQINGRNQLSWQEKFELDVWYVDNWSHTLDFKILLLTLIKVIKRDGINQIGFATAPEFVGLAEKRHNPGEAEQSAFQKQVEISDKTVKKRRNTKNKVTFDKME